MIRLLTSWLRAFRVKRNRIYVKEQTSRWRTTDGRDSLNRFRRESGR